MGVEILVQVHLEFLMKYVDHHFKEEEDLFKQTDYPKIDEHIKSHDALRETVLDFKKKVDASDMNAIEDFIPVAKKWLTNHIKVVDAEYVEYLKEKGIGTTSKLSISGS